MSDLNNIDQLLKDNFVDFTPDAPDVWQGIQQGVQAAQAGQAATAATVVKSTGLAVKILAAVAISAAVVTGYVLVNKSNDNNSTPKETTIVPTPTVENNPTVAISSQETATPERTTPAVPKTEVRPLTVSQKPVAHHQTVVESVSNAPEATVHDANIPAQQDLKVVERKTVEKAAVTNTVPPINRENRMEESAETTQPKADVQPTAAKPSERDEYGEVIIPNSFTPNGDGINDKFVIVIENEQFYSLTIMDRNGKEVFESNDKNIQWDGRDYKSGAVCPAGTYYRVFRYQLKGAQSESKTTGIIILIN